MLSTLERVAMVLVASSLLVVAAPGGEARAEDRRMQGPMQGQGTSGGSIDMGDAPEALEPLFGPPAAGEQGTGGSGLPRSIHPDRNNLGDDHAGTSGGPIDMGDAIEDRGTRPAD